MKTKKNIDSKFNLFLIFSVLYSIPSDAQAYFIGGMGAFIVEILAIVFGIALFFVKKLLGKKTNEIEAPPTEED